MKKIYRQVKLLSIIPQQHYLSVDKYKKIKESLTDLHTYGEIYVIEYRNQLFSVDGHHRLYHLYKQGVETVDVVCDEEDNENTLYQLLAEESLLMGLQSIKDLENRFITSYEEYKMRWIDKCQLLLLTNEEKEQYKENPCRYSALPLYKEIRMNHQRVDVIHDDEFVEKEMKNRKIHQRFFRLYHDLTDITYKKVDGFSVRKCHLENDVDLVVDIINQSYVDIKIDDEQVLLMMKDRVYCDDLWVFIVDEQTNKEVALGICQYDQTVSEVVFDWIQVLPAYRGKGVGSMLIGYLLNNAPSGAMFATVSGDVDNPSSPEKLYRKCGFKGQDVWHIMVK